MGLFSFFKKQFIDVIEWNESTDGVLAYRFPVADQEIQNGAQLTVRETQIALFVNEGEIADIFGPGRYTLTTKTLPLLTSLKNWDKGFNSPFKSDVYFFSTRDQLDQRWGTATPIAVRDKEFGPLRLRAHGTYSYRVKNPQTFFKKVSGTRDVYTTEELDGQLRSVVLTSLSTFFGSAEIAFLDMAAHQQKFSDTLKEALSMSFTSYGLELMTFNVQSISLPEEVQTHLDRASSMKMVGDLRSYTQFQAAESLTSAAQGGAAASGMGLGAGMALGQTLVNSLSTPSGSGPDAKSPEDALATLGKLHELLTKGVLTQAEFDVKKAELLKKIT